MDVFASPVADSGEQRVGLGQREILIRDELRLAFSHGDFLPHGTPPEHHNRSGGQAVGNEPVNTWCS